MATAFTRGIGIQPEAKVKQTPQFPTESLVKLQQIGAM